MAKVRKSKFKKWQKICLLVLLISLLVVIGLIIHKILVKYVFNNNDDNKVETIVKEELDLDNYNYFINSSATDYEKELFEDLKKVLSKKEVNDEEYAKSLAKVFVADLFSLKSKNNSSDISSSQYVYQEYRDTYEKQVKDSIYSSIELNLSGERTQNLPIVSNVEVTSVERISFSLKDKVIDNQAYSIKLSIKYETDLGYPSSYRVVLVKNNELLEVAKAIKN